jgi:hypothetical protein
MKPVYKFFAPLFSLVLLATSVVGVAFARHSAGTSGGSGEIEIVGVVEAISDSAWTIDGKVYLLTPATEIKGLIQPGARVKVHLYPGANGALTAREIEMAAMESVTDDRSGNNTDDRSSGETEIFGTVETITATAWKIDGKVYRITTATEIKGMIQPGAQVKVHLYLDANGVPTIREVELAGASITGDDSSSSGGSGTGSSGDDNSGDDSSSDKNDDSSPNGDDDSDDNSNDDHDDDDNYDDDDDDDDYDDDYEDEDDDDD